MLCWAHDFVQNETCKPLGSFNRLDYIIYSTRFHAWYGSIWESNGNFSAFMQRKIKTAVSMSHASRRNEILICDMALMCMYFFLLLEYKTLARVIMGILWNLSCGCVMRGKATPKWFAGILSKYAVSFICWEDILATSTLIVSPGITEHIWLPPTIWYFSPSPLYVIHILYFPL